MLLHVWLFNGVLLHLMPESLEECIVSDNKLLGNGGGDCFDVAAMYHIAVLVGSIYLVLGYCSCFEGGSLGSCLRDYLVLVLLNWGMGALYNFCFILRVFWGIQPIAWLMPAWRKGLVWLCS